VRPGEAQFRSIRYLGAPQEELSFAHGGIALADDDHARGEISRRSTTYGVAGAHQREILRFLPLEDTQLVAHVLLEGEVPVQVVRPRVQERRHLETRTP
jgi:hypothetical protein